VRACVRVSCQSPSTWWIGGGGVAQHLTAQYGCLGSHMRRHHAAAAVHAPQIFHESLELSLDGIFISLAALMSSQGLASAQAVATMEPCSTADAVAVSHDHTRTSMGGAHHPRPWRLSSVCKAERPTWMTSCRLPEAAPAPVTDAHQPDPASACSLCSGDLSCIPSNNLVTAPRATGCTPSLGARVSRKLAVLQWRYQRQQQQQQQQPQQHAHRQQLT
jgi:hypothetical protein